MIEPAKKLTAAFLVLMAVAVALHLMLTPVYHDGSPEYPAWQAMNWLMAVATFIVLVVSCFQRFNVRAEASTFDRLRASLTFYGAVVLTMLFFWEWLWTLNPSSETGDAVTSHLVYFPIMDALFSVLSLTTGKHLWSDNGN